MHTSQTEVASHNRGKLPHNTLAHGDANANMQSSFSTARFASVASSGHLRIEHPPELQTGSNAGIDPNHLFSEPRWRFCHKYLDFGAAVRADMQTSAFRLRESSIYSYE